MGYLRLRGLSEADSEDLAQEVLAGMSREGFLEGVNRDRGRFRTLVLRVTQSLLASEFRKRFAEKRGGNRGSVPLTADLDAAVTPEEQSTFDREWVRNMIRLALERLGADSVYHRLLHLRTFEGRVPREIAKLLGCPVASGDDRLHKGKGRLRKHLIDLAREYCATSEEHDEDVELLLRQLA